MPSEKKKGGNLSAQKMAIKAPTAPKRPWDNSQGFIGQLDSKSLKKTVLQCRPLGTKGGDSTVKFGAE